MHPKHFDNRDDYYDYLTPSAALLARELLENDNVPDHVLMDFIDSHIDFVQELVHDTQEYREYVERYCKGVLGDDYD